jgi:hypothetical protein
VLAESGLGHLDHHVGRLGLRPHLIDVARRDELLAPELLVPLELALLPLRVGPRPLEIGREGAAAVPDPFEVGATRVHGGARAGQILPGRGEICPELVDRQVDLAAVQVRERLSLSDGVPQVDVEPDDGPRELGPDHGLLPREEAPDRVDAALNGPALDERGRDAQRGGLDRGGATLRGSGRARLRRGAGREQEPHQRANGDARDAGGDTGGRGRGYHERGAHCTRR